MPYASRLVPLIIVASAVGPARAQEVWQPPAPPCELRPGHGLVSDGLNHLTNAVETDNEERRARRLDQAFEVLTRAIRDQGQQSNPAAWYYLGRYYTIQHHVIGADSAFRKAVELAPQCEADIAQYRRQLQPDVVSEAVRQWQGGQADSALVSFRLAASLDPQDANVPLFLGMMYADQGALDSANRYVDEGITLAGDDPNLTRRRQQALLSLARAYDNVGQNEPAIQRIGLTRIRRDSVAKALARDSVLLARLIAEWAGKPLRPDVQQAVSRDSTAFARRVAASREAKPALEQTLRAESLSVAQALEPSVRAYERYHEQFPNDVPATLRLLRLYSLTGREAALSKAIAEVKGLSGFSEDQLLQTGLSIFNDGHYRAAAQLLEITTERNPYNRGALFVLARAYVTLEDAAALQRTAAKLVDLDPLNPQSLRMMAAAWDGSGVRDSALAYVARADTGIGWAVNITQFVPSENSAVANGTVQNVTGRPLAATTLAFEFLGADGSVLAREVVPIPALAPRAQHPLNVRVNVAGAVGWRYRRQ